MVSVFKAKEGVKEKLRKVAGINGIGVSWDDDEPAVVVNVNEDITDAALAKIPKEINGFEVRIQKLKAIFFQSK